MYLPQKLRFRNSTLVTGLLFQGAVFGVLLAQAVNIVSWLLN